MCVCWMRVPLCVCVLDAGSSVCVCVGCRFLCVCVCWMQVPLCVCVLDAGSSVCVCVLGIVSMDKILHFINTLLINYY